MNSPCERTDPHPRHEFFAERDILECPGRGLANGSEWPGFWCPDCGNVDGRHRKQQPDVSGSDNAA